MAKPIIRRPPVPHVRPSGPETVAAPAPAVESPTPRLGIPLTADKNAIDWNSMRDSTRDKLLALARNDSRFQQSAAPVTVEIFSDHWCHMILDAAGALEASIVARVYKVTAEQAAAMMFTDSEKGIITEPLQRVLNKYSSAWLATYQDEAALLVALATVHVTHLNRLRAAVEESQQRRPPVVVPMRHESEDEDGNA